MTPVTYRVDRGGEVFAMFPTIPADYQGRYVQSYQHVGQHGAADYWHCIRTSRPALPHEYADLATELVDRGYTDLTTVRRRSKAHEREYATALEQQR